MKKKTTTNKNLMKTNAMGEKSSSANFVKGNEIPQKNSDG